MEKDPAVVFRDLNEADFELLLVWLNEPHLRPFYRREPETAARIEEKYRPRLNKDQPCHCLIAELNDEPFGYTQWYLNASFPDYGMATIGEPAGVSFDYYIGATAHLGSGLGSEMLNAVVGFVAHLIEDSEQIFFVGHRTENRRAIRCSRRAGFIHRKDYVEEGLEHVLYARDERS